LTEKVVAAKQAGAKIIIIPKGNGKDLMEIPANVKKGLTFVQVEHMDEVLRHALERQPRGQLTHPEPPPAENPPEAFTHH
jgi:ATP-dependent Lon protease